MRALVRLAGIFAIVLLGATGTARGAVPVVNPVDPSAMDPCNQAPLAFNGTTTLAALGMGDFVSGPEANKPGHVWVTADAFVPADWGGPPGAPPPDPMRFVCVEWDDGSGMSGSIDINWQPPAGISVEQREPGPLLSTLALLGLFAAGLVISVIAFRRP